MTANFSVLIVAPTGEIDNTQKPEQAVRAERRIWLHNNLPDFTGLHSAGHAMRRKLLATASTTRERANVIRFLVVILALASGCLPAPAGDVSVTTDEAEPQPMQFEWRTEGPPGQCGKTCRTWISAIGYISEHTARDFEAFANDNNVQGATLVLDSVGGSVLAALELGTLIRRFDMTTTVGKTIALPSDDGEARAKLSPAASCQSMCAFLLLGGARRYVPPEARVLVHQIWLGHKSERALEASYTAEDLDLVQRDIGSIARYTVEMGGGIELLETALRVPPWNPMYALTAEEIRRVKLTTVDRPFEQDVPPVASLPGPQAAPADVSSNPLAVAIHTRGRND